MDQQEQNIVENTDVPVDNKPEEAFEGKGIFIS